MADQVVVLVPALNRPQNVEPLCKSLESSRSFAQLRLVYLVSPDDEAQQAAVEDCCIDYLPISFEGGGDYAHKINEGIRNTTEEWIFLAADDLNFWPEWADIAIGQAKTTGSQVIGTNDLGNRTVIQGRHSTHSLVHRDYVAKGTIDDPSRLLHEGYHHNWVDNEFIETAKARGQFSMASQSIVEHLHPSWHKGKMDDTYQKGLSTFDKDARLFRQRAPLWRNLGFTTPLLGVSQGGTKRQNAARWQSRHHP